MHMVRIREIVGAAGDRPDYLHGLLAGLSLHDYVLPWSASEGGPAKKDRAGNPRTPQSQNPLAGFSLDAPASVRTLVPPVGHSPPKTIKSLSVSPWNPPPLQLRQKGHLLYLQLTTNEGEQFQITSHVSGFFVNKSSNSKFDPFPKPPPKNAAAHSLFSLISDLSPSFGGCFQALLESNNKRDPLSSFQITNTIPYSPWLVSTAASSLATHQPDSTRSQETYLISGIENTETLRDWNEEIQSTRELPRDAVHERVFRERLTAKVLAEFNEAAARGAILVARGEVAPLNPTEEQDAQIFVYNNIFYSFGADGVGTFTADGGDEAARVAVGKDLCGVKAVNQLDVDGLSTPGTVIVDYLGKRLVAQSIVPGIFKQRGPEEHQVDYGGVDSRHIVAENEAFVPTFSKVSKALKIKKHAVWDKEGKKHTLEASVETKGLLGTDGRKYILDLYRLTPLDITWLDEYWSESEAKPQDRDYPHRMTVLRPELIESYWRMKLGDYVKAEVGKRQGGVDEADDSAGQTTAETDSIRTPITTGGETQKAEISSLSGSGDIDEPRDDERVDISDFSLALNPDVCCGQVPQTDEEKEVWTNDERDVREVCDFLHQKVMPELVKSIFEAVYGTSLTSV